MAAPCCPPPSRCPDGRPRMCSVLALSITHNQDVGGVEYGKLYDIYFLPPVLLGSALGTGDVDYGRSPTSTSHCSLRSSSACPPSGGQELLGPGRRGVRPALRHLLPSQACHGRRVVRQVLRHLSPAHAPARGPGCVCDVEYGKISSIYFSPLRTRARLSPCWALAFSPTLLVTFSVSACSRFSPMQLLLCNPPYGVTVLSPGIFP